MPINPKLKAQLEKTISDEGYRTRLIETLEDAPPDVQNLWMSKEEYTRDKNAFNEEKKKHEGEMKKFYDESKLAVTGWEAEATKHRTAFEQAQARLAELEKAGAPSADAGTNTEIAGLKTLMNELKTSFDTRLKDVVNQAGLDAAAKQYVGWTADQVFRMDEVAAQFQETFGRRMTYADKDELIRYNNELASKGTMLNLEEAFAKKNGEKLEENKKKQWEVEYEKTHKSLQPPTGGSGGAPGPSGGEKGPLQIRLDQLQREANGDKTGPRIYKDWKEASAAAADDLVKQGKY